MASLHDGEDDYFSDDGQGDGDEEEYYSDDGEGDGDGDEEEYYSYDRQGDEEYYSNNGGGGGDEQRYVVLTEEKIGERQEDGIDIVSSGLSLPRSSSIILLHHYHWDVDKLHEDWFADEHRVREAVGLPEVVPQDSGVSDDLTTCEICYDAHRRTAMNAAACGLHLYCVDCWRGYIGTAIAGGPGSLTLRCPHPSCGAAVGQALIDAVAAGEDRVRYKRHLVRSYVEGSKKVKWCPGPGCEFAVEFVPPSEGGARARCQVLCDCYHKFCWSCMEEAHRPLDCSTVAMWVQKNTSESENTNWMLANSKPCPNCKRPIEKNQGCMHMRCTAPCNFQFCWLCLGDWNTHGEKTGGYYACNSYQAAKSEGILSEAEQVRREARESFQRYTHYYERWVSNDRSLQKALEGLRGHKILCPAMEGNKGELKFVVEAWEQIVECRRVLKWTYAYGYTLEEPVKRMFFEDLQGQADSGLERLHKCAEMELDAFLEGEDAAAPARKEGFGAFRDKLKWLTKVTGQYFGNLVSALEAGLKDVHDTTGKCQYKGHWAVQEDFDERGNWVCEICTYANPVDAFRCQMCEVWD